MHWTLWGVSPRAGRVRESSVPPGAVQGRNGFGKTGYGPPCPPPGAPAHHYVFTLYALRGPLRLPAGAAANSVLKAIARGSVASGSLIATYGR